jgi:hypothetical protein
MRMFALNMVSVGGTLESLSGDLARAEAIIADWPSPDLLQAFGVSRGDVDRMYAVSGWAASAQPSALSARP